MSYRKFKADLEDKIAGTINMEYLDLLDSKLYNTGCLVDNNSLEKKIKRKLKKKYPLIKVKLKDINISSFWVDEDKPLDTYLSSRITINNILEQLKEHYPEELI